MNLNIKIVQAFIPTKIQLMVQLVIKQQLIRQDDHWPDCIGGGVLVNNLCWLEVTFDTGGLLAEVAPGLQEAQTCPLQAAQRLQDSPITLRHA